MFGYIVPNYDALSSEDLARYRALYCGICHSLGARYGLFPRMTLTYDLAFLAALLSSLYEPEENLSHKRCAPHPFKTHAAVKSEIVDYAADMNIALSYHKLLDDWQDEKKLTSRAAAETLKRAYTRVFKSYPEKCAAIEENLKRINHAQNAAVFAVDDAVNAFAAIMSTVFVYRMDRWESSLSQCAGALGRFIYMMDAYDDFERDRKRGRPNPFSDEPKEASVRETLTVLLGECAIAFECLPLERDLPLLRNILYSGVWTRFAQKKAEKEKQKGKEEQDGSV